MAAAEYYTTGPQPAATSSPYQRPVQPQGSPALKPFSERPQPPSAQSSPYQRPQQLQGSPVVTPLTGYPPAPSHLPQYSTHQPAQQEARPSVHFAQQSRPPLRASLSNQAPMPVPSQPHRPSFSGQSQGHLQPAPQYIQQSNSYQGPPPQGFYARQNSLQPPPHMRPYMNGNESQQSLGSGSTSDPESRRRRPRRHSHNTEREMKDRPRKHRSRSTNTDGLIGAAGGGLIGDLIFPGLGTVGGVVAGWLGGQGYGKHRKHQEDKLNREQADWERRYRGRSDSPEYRDHDREKRSYERHKSEY